ncbi:MAG: methionyl-tRNA formyltransferase [Candidatus Pacebacteria bacterium]|nr:methionyl-tRNA formyltransferase [Candidatus Paceibacterota bacterium]MBP9867122.1 methionyl-tRNA formyltransferase [Candidatus Paceibacterota bacterium]
MTTTNVSYVFFGTGALAESVLASLMRGGYTPKAIVTKPDSLQGRHMQLTSPHIKTWADSKGIDVFQPKKLDQDFFETLSLVHADLFIVASYGKIIPENILILPVHGVLNVHPSLLPLYRGPSPIESTLLHGDLITGVTIIKLDKEMDHGPIVAQNAFTLNPEVTSGTLEVESGQRGGELLVQVLPHYLEGTLIPKEQDHSKASICKKITKEIGEITLNINANDVRCKFRALTPWPSVYFFHKHDGKTIRVKVASIDMTTYMSDDQTAKDIILSVVPEGKKEMDFQSFLRGYSK